MATLTEQSIISAFIGKLVNNENLEKCGWKQGIGEDIPHYNVYSSTFLYKPELIEAFGVTQKLKELWERRGTEFIVSVYVADGKITSVSISKENEGDGARPRGGSLVFTQQDLRIARRILEYITA